jgi:DNA-binding transcriptional LysR family regulator
VREQQGVRVKILDREPMVVALHRDHPLAACDSLALEQLRDTPVVLFPQEVAPGLYDRVHGCCERAGIDVQHALQSSQLSSSLSMVSAGGGLRWCRNPWRPFLRQMSPTTR